MTKQPIHQNLNTSFVNVASLVRYLSGLQFVGSIRIELSSYEADITFTGSKTLRAREYDHIAGRVSHGEQALRRILIRAREPHGRVHVYKSVGGGARHGNGSAFVDESIIGNAREMAASGGGTIAATGESREHISVYRDPENALVLAALSELLTIVDEALAERMLSFSWAFQLACDSIASEYPFIDRNRHALVYKNGEIRLNAFAQPETVTSAVFDALRPIFDRLRGERKYSELVSLLTERLRKSSTERRADYVRLGLMDHLEMLLAHDSQ